MATVFNKKYLKRTLIALLALFLALFLFYLSVYFGLWGPVPTKKQLAEIQQAEASEVLAADGELLGKYYLFDRQSIPYSEMPKHLIDALIATEDARFYEHNGIDGQSLLRVFFKTILLQDASSGGGSTITQQLAKNLYSRKDLNKVGIVVTKLRESIIARRMEAIYSKEEIVALYLNTVPFSDNTYGIESASKKFFNKPAIALTLPEAATLVGTLKASRYYNPRVNPEHSTNRRNVVLHQMEKYKYLHPEEAAEAKKAPLELNYQYYQHNKGKATYFREQVRKELKKILDTLKKPNGESYALYRDGLKIHTTLDYTLQEYAENTMKTHMEKLQQAFEAGWGSQGPWHTNKLVEKRLKKVAVYNRMVQGGFTEEEITDSLRSKTERQFFGYPEYTSTTASVLDSIEHHLKFLSAGMISLEAETGAVKTWIGGVDYETFQYDHVAQSKRQIGSTFKPIVYTAALENGMDPCSYFPIEAVTYDEEYRPTNASEEELEDPHMNYSLKYALQNSINTIAVKVLMETGIANTIEQAQKLGIETQLPEVPSLALGTAEITLLELAEAYTAYTNDGVPMRANFITKIEDKHGNKIASFTESKKAEKAFSDTTRHVMLDMMQATVDKGTAKRIRAQFGLQQAIAGKTGTTQDNRDGWFVGITPKLTTVCWVGHDQNIPFRSTAVGQGANSALPLFAGFYQQLSRNPTYNSYSRAKFETPPAELQEFLECEETKRDGFFKRLFKKSDKKEKKKKKKRGLFSIFKKKDKN